MSADVQVQVLLSAGTNNSRKSWFLSVKSMVYGCFVSMCIYNNYRIFVFQINFFVIKFVIKYLKKKERSAVYQLPLSWLSLLFPSWNADTLIS